MVMAMDVARGNQVASNDDTSAPKPGGPCHNCGTKHPLKQCPTFWKFCYYCKKRRLHFSQILLLQSITPSLQQHKKKDINDFGK